MFILTVFFGVGDMDELLPLLLFLNVEIVDNDCLRFWVNWFGWDFKIIWALPLLISSLQLFAGGSLLSFPRFSFLILIWYNHVSFTYLLSLPSGTFMYLLQVCYLSHLNFVFCNLSSSRFTNVCVIWVLICSCFCVSLSFTHNIFLINTVSISNSL